MMLLALLAMVLGILAGQSGWFPAVDSATFCHWVLALLMVSVGISIGADRTFLQNLKQCSLRMLFLPCAVVVASVASGCLVALVCGHTALEGMSITACMGWYSLGGMMLTDLHSSLLGSIGFLSSLLREWLAFLLAPWLIHHYGSYSAIAAAAATSEDTTLPVLIRYGGESVILLSVLSGMLVSALVPVCISLLNI